MPDGQIVLCDACGSRQATIFLTQICGSEMKKTNLCETCNTERAASGEGPFVKMIDESCIYCGAPASGTVPGSAGRAAICTECSKAALAYMLEAFGLDPATESDVFVKKLKEMHPEAKAKAVRKMDGFETSLRKHRQWYAFDAYTFVLDSVQRAFSHPENLLNPGNATATEMLDAMRLLAIERFGTGAREQLCAWGVTRCEDFGEIVFRLIAIGRLSGSPEDKKEDFNGGYDFEPAFPQSEP